MRDLRILIDLALLAGLFAFSGWLGWAAMAALL